MVKFALTVALFSILFVAPLNSQRGPPGPPGDPGATGATGATGGTGGVGDTGRTGATGDTGRPGAAGPQGLQGPTGSRGPDGGTGYTGPKGERGDMGATGGTGATGSSEPEQVSCTGEVGPPGPPGATGMMGATGATGMHGQVGQKGQTGPIGDTGSAYSGPPGTGSEGLQGLPGDTGHTGADGVPGATGDIGYTGATGVQGKRQTIRTKRQAQGCPGPKGPTGATGGTGATGDTGHQGATGQVGDTGATGVHGTDNPDGSPGDMGPPGPTGRTGVRGATGATGAKGPHGNTGAHGISGLPALRNPPAVDDVQPRHGPASGNTVVTVTGSRLKSVELLYVHYGDKYKWTADDQSSATDSMLVVRTPPVGDDVLDRNLSVVLEYSGQLYIETNRTFMFYRTINVTGVRPSDHLNTGGTRVTLKATNIVSGTTPTLVVRVVSSQPTDSMYSVACTTSYITQTAACLMPALGLPSELAGTTSTTPNVPGAAASFTRGSTWANVFVGVRMNNPLSYYDLNTSLVFYPPPTISAASDVITVVQGQTVTLTIEGANMRRGCRIGDYIVTVGTIALDNDRLDNDRLVVRLLDIESYDRGDDNSCDYELYPVRVSVGHHTVEYGCLEFVSAVGSSSSSNNTLLIVGLVVGITLLVLVVVLVVVVVCCAVRSRRRRKAGGEPVNYNNLRATEQHYADVSNTAGPANGQGTTRSFMFGTEHLSDKPEESVVVNQY